LPNESAAGLNPAEAPATALIVKLKAPMTNGPPPPPGGGLTALTNTLAGVPVSAGGIVAMTWVDVQLPAPASGL